MKKYLKMNIINKEIFQKIKSYFSSIWTIAFIGFSFSFVLILTACIVVIIKPDFFHAYIMTFILFSCIVILILTVCSFRILQKKK